MTYNANEATAAVSLPPDSMLDGRIVKIEDGKIKDFVKNLAKWEGDVEQPAINATVSVTHDKKEIQFNQIFGYILVDGKTQYAPKSNIGKFKAKYGKLPQVGLTVRVVTNSEGYGKIKLA